MVLRDSCTCSFTDHWSPLFLPIFLVGLITCPNHKECGGRYCTFSFGSGGRSCERQTSWGCDNCFSSSWPCHETIHSIQGPEAPPHWTKFVWGIFKDIFWSDRDSDEYTPPQQMPLIKNGSWGKDVSSLDPGGDDNGLKLSEKFVIPAESPDADSLAIRVWRETKHMFGFSSERVPGALTTDQNGSTWDALHKPPGGPGLSEMKATKSPTASPTKSPTTPDWTSRCYLDFVASGAN